jgi:flagellar L-ring protein precursor FlgH
MNKFIQRVCFLLQVVVMKTVFLNSVKIIAVGAFAIMLSACTTFPGGARPGDPEYAPVTTATPEPPPASPGGIYQIGHGLSLFDDRRAYQVGDIVTVVLSEKTTASKAANSEIKKEDDIGIGAGVVLGQSPPNIGDYTMETSVKADREFKGEADADQKNSLQGSIAVTISQIMPNGLLQVRGEKWITLNTGDEFIRISGLLRPEDINSSNQVPSTKLADARITYSGTGALADANRQGWASRFFNSPYWPF